MSFMKENQRRIEPLNHSGFEWWEKEFEDMESRGKRLITSEAENMFCDEYGDSSFDYLIVRDYRTGKMIRAYKYDEIDQANADYKQLGWFHADCYEE